MPEAEPFVPGGWRGLSPIATAALEDRRVVLVAGEDRLLVDFLADGVARFRWIPSGEIPSDASWTIRERPVETAPLLALDTGFSGRTCFKCGELQVLFDPVTNAVHFLDGAGHALLTTLPRAGLAGRGRERRIEFDLQDGEMDFGFGERTGKIDKRGSVLRMWNTDAFLYDRFTDPLYSGIPFWIGLRRGVAHGVFLDNTHPMAIDLGARDRHVLSIAVEAGAIDLYVIVGPHPKQVLQRFTRLVGRAEIPPRWALGFQQCRYSYMNAKRMLEVARTFREKRIPCDVLYLDIHHLDRFRSFTWDPVRFPDPEGLLRELHGLGFKVVAIVDPGLAVDEDYAPYASAREGGHLLRLAEGSEARGRVWPGTCAFPDFSSERTRAWWGGLYADLVRLGVDGFWNDMNEPAVFGGPGGSLPHDVLHDGDQGPQEHLAIHNVYGQLMAEATRDGQRRLAPDRRPFVLSRAGWAGIQRAAAQWSGDNGSSWADLKLSIPMALGMAVSGQPFFGADIGGFAGDPGAELFVRWLQAGVFYGLMRVHTCIGTPDQEPWSFGAEAEDSARAAIELRYRLLPLLESLFDEAARTGVPPLRPLFLEWPGEAPLARREDVFLLGPSLLVAPVLEPEATHRRIPLPPGRWFIFPEGTVLAEKREVTVEAPLDRIPMLARGGGIIPWALARSHSDVPLESRLVIKAFAGGDGSFTLVEDAGDGPAASAIERRRITMTITTRAEEVELRIAAPQGSFPGSVETLEFEIHGVRGTPAFIEWEMPAARRRVAPGTPGWKSDSASAVQWIDVPVASLPHAIFIPHDGGAPDLDRRVEARPGTAPPEPHGLGAIVLEAPRNLVLPEWWRVKPLRAIVAANHAPDRLRLLGAVQDVQKAAPCDNEQGDGFYVTLRSRGDAAKTPRRFHAATPAEGGGLVELIDHQWRPAANARTESVQLDSWTLCWITIAPAAFGLETFEAGMEFEFDAGVQLSDAERRRGSLEWVQAFTDPEEPGGTLVLLSSTEPADSDPVGTS